MIINKYNSAKGNLSTRTGVSTVSISSDSSSSSSGGVSLDRVLWGQNDDGSDIDGSMWVNGSLYLGAIDYGSEDDEEDTTDAGVFVDDAEIGSVIASGLVQGKDMYCKEHPYITYPIVNGKKTDLRELFNGFDERIKTNATNIATNKTNISTNATNIAANTAEITKLKSRVTTNATNIAANTAEIKNINEKITNITALQDAMPVGSIVMFSGKIKEIPSGWAICDGTNGTPNLIDRFILGSHYAGGMGGNSQVTLTVSQLPPHKHSVAKSWYGKSDNAEDRQVVRWDETVDTNSQVWTEETGLGLPIDIMPPYYRLIYIMKIATT